MSPPFQRLCTANEKLYLAARTLLPPFAIQAVIEGHGSLTKQSLENAVARAAPHCPGSRLILAKNGRTWTDSGQNPPVSEFDPRPAAFADSPPLRQPLSPSAGPTAEVLLSTGSDSKTILFRAFHGSMDGRGTLRWAEEVFRALRGETPVQATSTLTDSNYRKALTKPQGKRPTPPNDLPHPLRCSPLPNPPADFHWLRRTIHGHPQALVAKVAECIATYSASPARFMVPVDIRRHGDGLDSTANLTLPIFLETEPKAPWESIQKNLLAQLAAHAELARDPLEKWVQLIPVPALRSLAKFAQKRQAKKARYPISAILSHLGKVDLPAFSCPGFYATSVFTLPVHAPLIPLSFTFVESGTHTEICLSCDRDPAALRASEALLDRIVQTTDTPKSWPAWSANQTDTPFPADLTIPDLFTDQAVRTPDHTALTEGENSITYAELDRSSTRLAADFRAKGIAPGELVAVLVNRSILGITTILATLKSGAAYLPLDPTYPPDFLTDILKDSRVRHGITEPDLHHLTDSIPLEIRWILPEESDFTLPLLPSSPESDAYVIYTSGSSGKPKGVVITHSSLANYARWAVSEYGIGPHSRFALFTSLAFDLSVTSLFPPLISGGSIGLYSKKFDAQILTAVLQSTCNSLKLTPAHLDLLTSLNAAKQLDLLVVGGEQFTTATALRAHQSFGATIFNEYGPTEATVGCIAHRFSPTKDALTTSVPIGKPGANVTIRLLDDARQEVPFHAPGEIYISGSGLARAYLHSPNLTEKGFITLPDGTRAYRTGDLARIDSHGQLQFLGRLDNQIKIRGFRIEPATVENAIRATGDYQDALVVGQNNSLVAYVIPNIPTITTDLRADLSRILPSHLVPTSIIPVPEFPLTPNGKIDLSALQKLDAEVIRENPTLAAPNTLLTSISRIWSFTLTIPLNSIAPDSNFHHLGGDSLSFLQMLIAVSKLCDAPADFMEQTGTILTEPTLAEITRIAQSCGARNR